MDWILFFTITISVTIGCALGYSCAYQDYGRLEPQKESEPLVFIEGYMIEHDPSQPMPYVVYITSQALDKDPGAFCCATRKDAEALIVQLIAGVQR